MSHWIFRIAGLALALVTVLLAANDITNLVSIDDYRRFYSTLTLLSMFVGLGLIVALWAWLVYLLVTWPSGPKRRSDVVREQPPMAMPSTECRCARCKSLRYAVLTGKDGAP